MPVKDTAREAAFAAIEATRDEIVRVSLSIHDDPEPAGEEHRASEQLRTLLAAHGFEIESGIAGLPTAFRAAKRNYDTEAMRKGLRHGSIAVVVRADADPANGHAEGRPLGVAASLIVALGLGAVLDSEHGAVTVVGAPGDTGLVAMARAGVFDEFDAVLSASPASTGEGFCYTIESTGDQLAARTATLTTEGDASALLTALVETVEAHDLAGTLEVLSSENGTELTLTSQTGSDLLGLSAAIQRVVDETPGASLTFGTTFDDMIVNRIIARRTKTYADTFGFKFDRTHKSEPAPANGWGSVSYASPTFVLNFPFTTDTVVRGDAEFGSAAVRSSSFDRAFEYARCLCLAGLDVLREIEFRSIADDQLVKALAKRGIRREHRRWLGVHPVIKDANEASKKKGPKLADFKMVRGPGMRDN
jgi:hypothetical protein